MLDILRDNLLNYLTTQPYTGVDPQVEDLQEIKSGWESAVYRFDLTHDENGHRVRQRLVLKTFTDNVTGKDRALKERHALYHLRTARYSVPGVLAVEIDPQALGVPFIIMEHIDARTMSDQLSTSSPDALPELARQFVGLMTGLHALGYSVLVPRMKPVSALALVNREIYTMRGFVDKYALYAFTPVLDWLYANRQAGAGETPVVTHRDFHPSNVLLTENGVPFVIDWGWQVSDPRYDLAVTLAQLHREGQDAFAGAVLAEYERVNGQAVQGLSFFTTLAITRWLMDRVILAQVTPLDIDDRLNMIDESIEPVRYAVYEITQATGISLPSAETLLN